ncbi:hypothetical protein ACIPY5_12250 [Microbacterium sp. NPDC089698]|uniref:hypothetical protein n=1 Tax=Microbacterium sp. NPDC089698 TaxID=3364200 RepID=UPI0037FBD97C
MNREHLIEKTAEAIHGAHHPTTGEIPAWEQESETWRNTYRDFARAALSMFEEPNTSVDDVREALAIYDLLTRHHFSSAHGAPKTHCVCGQEVEDSMPEHQSRVLVAAGFHRISTPTDAVQEALVEEAHLAANRVQRAMSAGEEFDYAHLRRLIDSNHALVAALHRTVQGEPSAASKGTRCKHCGQSIRRHRESHTEWIHEDGLIFCHITGIPLTNAEPADFVPCGLGSCAAEDGHDGACPQASGWSS